MADLVYVGDFKDGQKHVPVLGFTSDSAPLPTKVSPGHRYLFHRVLSSPDFVDRIADRLRVEGFTLQEGANPPFAEGYLHVDLIGGSANVWAIRFARGSCRGTIISDVCTDLHDHRRLPWVSSRWETADYTLEVQGDCDGL